MVARLSMMKVRANLRSATGMSLPAKLALKSARAAVGMARFTLLELHVSATVCAPLDCTVKDTPPRTVDLTKPRRVNLVLASGDSNGGCSNRPLVYPCARTFPKWRDRYVPIAKAPAISAKQVALGQITTGC